MQTHLNLAKKTLLENAGFEASHLPILNLLFHKEIIRFFTGISVSPIKIRELVAAFSSVEGVRVETGGRDIKSFGLNTKASLWRFYVNEAPFAALIFDGLQVASLMVIPGVTEKIAISGALLDAASEKEPYKQNYTPFFYSSPREAELAMAYFCDATSPWSEHAKTEQVPMEQFQTFGPLESGIFSRTISFDSKTEEHQGQVIIKHEPVYRDEIKSIRRAGEFIDNEIRAITSCGLLIGNHQGFLGTYQYFYNKEYDLKGDSVETRKLYFRVLPSLTLRPL